MYTNRFSNSIRSIIKKKIKKNIVSLLQAPCMRIFFFFFFFFLMTSQSSNKKKILWQNLKSGVDLDLSSSVNLSLLKHVPSQSTEQCVCMLLSAAVSQCKLGKMVKDNRKSFEHNHTYNLLTLCMIAMKKKLNQ